MKCLVISDPETKTAAAALDVNAGCQSDPRDTPGLAHLLERTLLRLGTEKYPVENYYHSFISESGGYMNSRTWTEDTRFYFQVSSDKLLPSLDIFSQFFINPIFTIDTINNELRKIDLDFRYDLKDDSCRFNHLSINTALDWHSYKRFRTGNKETLNKPDIYEQVKEFYSTKYSSNLMSIVVYGKENTETLENWVRQCFTEVVNKNLIPETDMRMPYDETVTGILIKQYPIRDLKKIRFFWYWPADMMHYKSKPGRYIAWLLGHEGKNSLFSFLNAEGLIREDLATGNFQRFLNYSNLELTIELTDKGEENYERVIEIVHAYIAMLKEKGVQEWIYEEIKTYHQAHFNFRKKSDPLSYCDSLSWNLHRYPYEKIVTCNDLMEEFDPDLLRSFIDLITPQCLQIYFFSKKFGDSQMQTEKWYGTKYSIERFSDYLLNKMNSPQVFHPKIVLDLPIKNNFISTIFEVLPSFGRSLPKIILDNGKNTVTHKLGNSRNIDKVSSELMIYCNDARFQTSPYSYILGKIWTSIFWDKFREENYVAKMAGLKLDLKMKKAGLYIKLSGYSQKYDKFFETVLERLATMMIDSDDRELFQSHHACIYNALSENFFSELLSQPFSVAYELMEMHRAWPYPKAESLNALQNITFEDLLCFQSKWLKNVRFEWTVKGNFSMGRTISMVESCTRIFEQPKICNYI